MNKTALTAGWIAGDAFVQDTQCTVPRPELLVGVAAAATARLPLHDRPGVLGA